MIRTKLVAKLAEPFNHVLSGIISMPIDLPRTQFNRGIKASKFVKEELMKIMKHRKVDIANGTATQTQDILSRMLSYCDEDGKYMTQHDIADKILGMLVGDHDTTKQMAIAKSKAPGELLNWQDIEKMKYSWNVACEVMRLVPPSQGGFREAINDFVFNGFSIPKRLEVVLECKFNAHRNREYFEEPEKFDPSRFEGKGPAPFTYVPFGGGPRMCPGKEYARMVILVFMHHLVKRFKWETLIPNENIIVNPMAIPAKGLPIRLYPHQALKGIE
ncbi:hypothetical protein CR513_08914, partial [Mucuna pruriens]